MSDKLGDQNERCKFNYALPISSVVVLWIVLMFIFFLALVQFSAAYDILTDMEKWNVKPTATIYNTIMAGYFREVSSIGFLYLPVDALKPYFLEYKLLILHFLA